MPKQWLTAAVLYLEVTKTDWTEKTQMTSVLTFRNHTVRRFIVDLWFAGLVGREKAHIHCV